MTNRKIYKSAISGKIVSREYAEANPDTTYAQAVKDAASEAADGFNQQHAVNAIAERITPEMQAENEQFQAEQRGILKDRLGSLEARIARAKASANVVLKNIESLQGLADSDVKQARLENAFNQLAELYAEQGKYADAGIIAIDGEKRKYYRDLGEAVDRADADVCGCPDTVVTDSISGRQERQPAMHKIANVISLKHRAVAGLYQCLTCGFKNVRQ